MGAVGCTLYARSTLLDRGINMASIYDLLEAPVSDQIRKADELALGSVQAQLDAVPTAAATERDVANIIFNTRQGGISGGANLLRSREAAGQANQIRMSNRGAAADRALAAASQMGEFAMRGAQEVALAETFLQEQRTAGIDGERIMRSLQRLYYTMTTEQGRAAVLAMMGDEQIEHGQAKGNTNTGAYPGMLIDEGQDLYEEGISGLGEAYGGE